MIRPVRTEAEHESALRQIERLWGAADGSRKGDRLEVLITLVEAYERTHYPVDPPDPLMPSAFDSSSKEPTGGR